MITSWISACTARALLYRVFHFVVIAVFLCCVILLVLVYLCCICVCVVHLVSEGYVGAGIHGDIAIDDVTINPGQCSVSVRVIFYSNHC